ncbi:MAG: deoxyribose-phosphate aldolase [Planctomycetota bacterium]
MTDPLGSPIEASEVAEPNRLIDHTHLAPCAMPDEIDRLCDEALEHDFAAVCVSPVWVARAHLRLEGSSTAVATVIGFPHGADLSATKATAARLAQEQGASELDMVMSLGRFAAGDQAAVQDEIAAVVAEREPGHLVKVILETAYWDLESVERACRLAMDAGADFVKTSTGFGPGGATIEAVSSMRRVVGDRLGVKASGGIRDFETLVEMVQAGATRIGTSSGLAIMKEFSA